MVQNFQITLINALTVTLPGGWNQPRDHKMTFLRHKTCSDHKKDPQDSPLKFCDATFGHFRFNRKSPEMGLNQPNHFWRRSLRVLIISYHNLIRNSDRKSTGSIRKLVYISQIASDNAVKRFLSFFVSFYHRILTGSVPEMGVFVIFWIFLC